MYMIGFLVIICLLMPKKFQYICFSPHSPSSSNIYTSSSFDIINYSRNIIDLGINVSSDSSFDFNISNLAKRKKTFNWLDTQNFLLSRQVDLI